MSEYSGKLKVLLEELKAKGLKSIDLYPGDNFDKDVDPEAYYAEVCRLLESIKDGSGSKLVFKDSRKK